MAQRHLKRRASSEDEQRRETKDPLCQPAKPSQAQQLTQLDDKSFPPSSQAAAGGKLVAESEVEWSEGRDFFPSCKRHFDLQPTPNLIRANFLL